MDMQTGDRNTRGGTEQRRRLEIKVYKGQHVISSDCRCCKSSLRQAFHQQAHAVPQAKPYIAPPAVAIRTNGMTWLSCYAEVSGRARREAGASSCPREALRRVFSAQLPRKGAQPPMLPLEQRVQSAITMGPCFTQMLVSIFPGAVKWRHPATPSQCQHIACLLQIREEKPEQAPERALKFDSPAPPPTPSAPQKQPEPSFAPPAKVSYHNVSFIAESQKADIMILEKLQCCNLSTVLCGRSSKACASGNIACLSAPSIFGTFGTISVICSAYSSTCAKLSDIIRGQLRCCLALCNSFRSDCMVCTGGQRASSAPKVCGAAFATSGV